MATSDDPEPQDHRDLEPDHNGSEVSPQVVLRDKLAGLEGPVLVPAANTATTT